MRHTRPDCSVKVLILSYFGTYFKLVILERASPVCGAVVWFTCVGVGKTIPPFPVGVDDGLRYTGDCLQEPHAITLTPHVLLHVNS